jgi:hypothetical protein
MSITLSLVLENTVCCEQVHQCGKMPASSQVLKELPWTKDMKYVPFDKYDFIWKKYSQHEYITLYSEDATGIQILRLS